MLKIFGEFSYSFYRAAFFSMVTAPSIVLFIIFAFLSFNNSLADDFLSEARGLTENAPANKVQVCIYETQGKMKNPVPSVKKEPCVPTLIDAISWRDQVDSNIREFYFIVCIIGFITWFLYDGCLSGFLDKIFLMVEKRKK